MVARLAPEGADVVVRQKPGHPTPVYLLGTPLAPNQFIVRTRDQAVAQAIAFAQRQHVRAWFASGDEFVLLGTFGTVAVEPIRSS